MLKTRKLVCSGHLRISRHPCGRVKRLQMNRIQPDGDGCVALCCWPSKHTRFLRAQCIKCSLCASNMQPSRLIACTLLPEMQCLQTEILSGMLCIFLSHSFHSEAQAGLCGI